MEAVFIDRKRTDVLEDGFEATRLAVANGEKIGVPCWAVGFLRPEFKKQRLLQKKNLPESRFPDPKEKAFQRILRQKQPKILSPITSTMTLPSECVSLNRPGFGEVQSSPSSSWRW